MPKDYKVHKEWIEEVEFEILVIEIPHAEIEDKLAYFARDKGKISKSFYEDFVIATCVANINQLLYHIKQYSERELDMYKIREEVMSKILVTNPLMNPNNLVINRNSVVKLRSEKGEEGERPLTENKNWEIASDEVEEDPNSKQSTEERKRKSPSELRKVSDLECTIIKKWWRRINSYVEVRQFSEEDIESIIGYRLFHNRSSFQTHIVTTCVVDSEDLFATLDDMGIPSRIAPPTLMNEVYELCRDANPFLTYENAQDLASYDEQGPAEDDAADDEDKRPGAKPGGNSKMISHAKKGQDTKKKKKKAFRDVPKEDLLKLGDVMKVFVIGQDSAVDQLTEAIQRASVGLKDPEKPIGSFIFAGRTGCGKTLASKVLADELIKDRNNLITIDCSEYSADHEYSKLIGAASGYVGYEQGGILTNAVLENPFSVVVFDEIEKASHKVYELMLQILDEGRLTDNKGNKVSFKDTVIIMTSNIGVNEVEDVCKTIGFGDVAKLTEDKKTKAIDGAIKKKFKPEFINRIDAIVHFNSLTKKDYSKIIDIELYKLNENLKTNDTEFKALKLEFDDKVREFIFKHGIDEAFGARPLKRCIEREVSTPLANRLLRGNIAPDSSVMVTTKRGKVVFEVMSSIIDNDMSLMSVGA